MAGNLTLKLTMTADGRAFVQTVEGAGKSVAGFAQKAVSGFGQLKASLTSAGAQVTALAGALGVGSLVRNIVSTNTEFARLQASLNTVTGSAEAGKRAFEEMTDFAAQTPFDLQQAVEGFTRLSAMGLEPTIERATPRPRWART